MKINDDKYYWLKFKAQFKNDIKLQRDLYRAWFIIMAIMWLLSVF